MSMKDKQINALKDFIKMYVTGVVNCDWPIGCQVGLTDNTPQSVPADLMSIGNLVWLSEANDL